MLIEVINGCRSHKAFSHCANSFSEKLPRFFEQQTTPIWQRRSHMIKGVHHIGVSTRNLKHLLQFYCDVLGFELIREMGWKSGTELGDVVDRIIGIKNSSAKGAMVTKGGVTIEMFEYSAPEPKPIPSGWKVCDHGYTHICVEVDDIDGEYERLSKAGVTFHAPPQAFGGMKAVYCRDPEGHVIELLEVLPVA